MEQDDKRKKRALIILFAALFCVAAVGYVAFGDEQGGFFTAGTDNNADDKSLASGGGAGSNAGGGKQASTGVSLPAAPDLGFMGQEPPAQTEVALVSVRHHAADVGGSSGSFKGKSDDDLFKNGEPAAGIPAGKFIVAPGETPSAPAEQVAAGPSTAAAGATFAHPEANSGAPAPTGNIGPAGDGLLRAADISSDTPTPPSVPEASPLAMMGLGALLLTMVAMRRRNT